MNIMNFEKIKSWITKENISFAIAVLAFGLGIYNTFHLPELYSDIEFDIISHENGTINIAVENNGTKHSIVERIDVCLPSTFWVASNDSKHETVLNTVDLGMHDLFDN